MKIKLLLIALFLSLGIVGCDDKDDNKEIYPDAKIIKEFSLRTSPLCENGEVIIINSQKELNKLFKDSTLPKELANLDFHKYTLILGTYSTPTEIEKVEHKFTKTGAKYEYILTISLLDSTVPDGVSFGILVKKLPNNSEVILKVKLTP